MAVQSHLARLWVALAVRLEVHTQVHPESLVVYTLHDKEQHLEYKGDDAEIRKIYWNQYEILKRCFAGLVSASGCTLHINDSCQTTAP